MFLRKGASFRHQKKNSTSKNKLIKLMLETLLKQQGLILLRCRPVNLVVMAFDCHAMGTGLESIR